MPFTYHDISPISEAKCQIYDTLEGQDAVAFVSLTVSIWFQIKLCCFIYLRLVLVWEGGCCLARIWRSLIVDHRGILFQRWPGLECLRHSSRHSVSIFPPQCHPIESVENIIILDSFLALEKIKYLSNDKFLKPFLSRFKSGNFKGTRRKWYLSMSLHYISSYVSGPDLKRHLPAN